MMYCKLLAVTLLLAASCQARPKWGSAQRSSPWGQSGNHGSTWEMTIVEGVGPSGSQLYGVYPGNPWAGVDDDQVGSSSNQWNSQHGVQQGGQHGVNSPSWGSSGMSANIRNNPSGSNWGSQQQQGRSGSPWAGQQSQHGSGWGSGSSWKASGSGAWSGNGNGYGSNPWGGASEQSRAGHTNSWTNSWTNSADVDQPWSVGHLMNNPVSGGNRVNQVGKKGNGWVVVSSPWAGSDEDDQSVEVGNHGVHQASGRGWGQGVNHQGVNQQGSNQGSSWSWGQGQSSQRGNHVAGQVVVSRSLGQGGNHQGWNQGGNQHGVNQG
ncbi:uncharacterized protein LOC113213040, partial [Frankliniella occidentalis]|uniref:Uncharacterized protein LOC113213040 n=1 Tax=Frankliniella occidentalis TaxID=133901 RepID=A0A9C6XAY4_FRAOC